MPASRLPRRPASHVPCRLMGTFEHRLDAKARLVLPVKFRDAFGTAVVAVCGMEQCVSLYSMEEWDKFAAWMSSEPFMSSERTRKFQRVILSSAHEIDIDSAGRILLPVVLRSYACLEQDTVINGVNDHAEIWDKKRWTDYWRDGISMMCELAGRPETNAVGRCEADEAGGEVSDV